MKKTPKTLPFRVAQPRHASLDYMDEAYFEMLCRCGYDGLYLQMSPFDSFSGNFHALYDNYHLIYLYDIARGSQKEAYQDYINTVCERAGEFGLNTYLKLWEPRLPFEAWSQTPPSWRGRGGFFRRNLNNHTAFCWSEPDAVAYWKQMCFDAFDAIPQVRGLHMGLLDNEAIICGEDCPKCKGQKKTDVARDVYNTLLQIKAKRKEQGEHFRVTIYGWWMPEDFIYGIGQQMEDQDTYIIGKSAQGLSQVIDGETVPGVVGDMTQVLAGAGTLIRERKEQADRMGLKVADAISWAHPIEAWWLPPPPNPRFAWEKMHALREIGAGGWYDFACGSMEPGSICETVALLTDEPDLSEDEAEARVLRGIFGDEHLETVKQAYALYHKGKNYFPIALDPENYDALSLRVLGLGTSLFGPFIQSDLTFLDTGHYPRDCFAPYLFLTDETMPHYGKHLPKGRAVLEEALETIRSCQVDTVEAQREVDAFEIYYRHFRAMSNYVKFGEAHYAYVHGEQEASAYQEAIQTIARDELENTEGLTAWIERNPTELGNPCWDLYGMLEDCWPGLDFRTAMLQPKRDSLQAILDGEAYPCGQTQPQRELAGWAPPYGKVPAPWNVKIQP